MLFCCSFGSKSLSVVAAVEDDCLVVFFLVDFLYRAPNFFFERFQVFLSQTGTF